DTAHCSPPRWSETISAGSAQAGLPAKPIERCKLARAHKKRLFRQAALALDPTAYRRRIGRGQEARLVRRRVKLALLIEPTSSVEAENGASRDTDTVLWHRTQHERAGREAGPVNDDPFARFTDHREQPEIGFN